MSWLADDIVTCYLGGTLGSSGAPLHPLPAPDFQHALSFHTGTAHLARNFFSPFVIDSAAIQPHDWVKLLSSIRQQYTAGMRKLLVIMGTDTLAVTAELIRLAIDHLQLEGLKTVFTAAQFPLFQSVNNLHHLAINPYSDAADNLKAAVTFLNDVGNSTGETGAACEVSIDGQIYSPPSLIKISSSSLPAFYGFPVTDVAPVKLPRSSRTGDEIFWRLQQVTICNFFAAPLPATIQEAQLAALLDLNPQALIIHGLGSGNLASTATTEALLAQAWQQKTLVVCTTQVPFGGTGDTYAAGDWLNTLHVVKSGNLPFSALYARLCWALAAFDFEEIRHHWAQLVTV